MKKDKVKTLIISLFVVFIIWLLGLVSWFYQTSNSFQIINAMKMGGKYLGNNNVVLQTEYNNCGPSALKMIFDYYHIPLSLHEIEKHIHMTEKGTSMLALKEIAEFQGLSVKGWKTTIDDIDKKGLPALLFINDNHFVVADSIKQGAVYLRDPGIGKIKLPISILRKIWNGEALVFQKK